MIYAQIDENGRCYAESVVLGPIEQDDLIEIPEADGSYLGRIWDGSAWQDAPPPDPVPVPQTKLGFLRLCQSLGGMTPQVAVDARNDPALAYLWLVLELAETVERDDPGTVEGLDAMEGLGYLPNGAAAVLGGWPMV